MKKTFTRRFAENASMKKWLYSTVAFCGFWNVLLGQGIPVNTWRNHVSFQNAQLITGGNGVTFCASENGLFSISDGSITLISKTDGLSQPGASAIQYIRDIGLLIVGHSTGAIDIVSSSSVTQLSALAEITSITNKSINAIAAEGPVAYIGTSFGIAVVDLTLLEIREFYSEIGPNGEVLNITDIAILDNFILASTSAGLLRGGLNNNLLDFNNWEVIANSPANALFAKGVKSPFLIATDSTVMSLVQDEFNVVEMVDEPIISLFQDLGSVFILGPTTLWRSEEDASVDVVSTSFNDAQSVYVDASDIFVADNDGGLTNINGESFVEIVPDGPLSDEINHIEFIDSLYVFYGGSSPTTDTPGFSSFSNSWNHQEIPGFSNISDVATFNGQAYLSSMGDGVFNLSLMEEENLSTEDPLNIPRIRPGPTFLYALVADNDEGLFQLGETGWNAFSAEEIGTTGPADILISQGGVVWIQNDRSTWGVSAFNPDGNLSFPLGTGQGLPSPIVNSIVIDRNDELWIGTNQGPVFVIDATFINTSTQALQPIFQGFPLLDGEEITALAVDGGNRKWIGTSSGLWVIDEEISTVDERFTAENSPLLSDEIVELTYDQESGEMFILTDRGLCSYRSGSSIGDFRHRNVTIFPNPVHPTTHDLVSISGLVENANLKITDINGNLVQEVDAIGGTATWNLRNLANQPVHGGVYLFFSSNFDGEETFVGKVAVVR